MNQNLMDLRIFRIGILLMMPFLGMAQIGNPAPDFTVTDVDGNTHRLYDYLEEGKAVVLDFYYTTCVPCQFYSPQVNLAYSKYGCNTANVIFLSLDYNDTNAEVIAYDNEYSIEYPSISGLEGGGNAVVNDYNIIGFPTFYVIDSSKTIIDQIDPPTLQVFDFRFAMHGILPASCTTSLEDEIESNTSISLFPNPVSVNHNLYIAFTEKQVGPCTYEIYDFTGRVIQTGSMRDAMSENEVKFTDLSPGMYYIKINTDQPIIKSFVVND